MDCNFDFLTKTITWRSPNDESKVEWSKSHLYVVRDYFNSISKACDFGELRYPDLFNDIFRHATRGSSTIIIPPEVAVPYAQKIRRVFAVPRPTKEFHHQIQKYQSLEAFLSFLLRLLHDKTDSIMINDLCKDRVENVEKELRFLLTVLGHTSLVLSDDEHGSEQVQKLLEGFEAVANEAGGLVHSLLFPVKRTREKMVEGQLSAVLQHIDLLNGSVMEFLNPVSSNGRQACRTPKASVVDSLLFIDSLIYYLKELRERKDSRVTDLMEQIEILHKGLTDSKSSIGEFEELLMQIGDMAHEAEYLIISFMVGDAPFWYIVNRLAKVSHKIELIGTELQEIAKKEKSGDLKFGKYFSTHLMSLQAKNTSEIDNVTVGIEEKAEHILEQLVEGTERLQVISIFGMAGIGKTTFAKKLYSHPLVNYRFDRLSWCVASQKYKRRNALQDIFTHLTRESASSIKRKDEKAFEEDLVLRIYQTLKGRRYLIVLDDTWDPHVWDDLRSCFPDDGNGSRILFTTRNKDVAPSDCNNYALSSLSNAQSWELLKKKVFGNESCPRDLVQIGMKIAENCGGLPLAVVVIAGILSTMDKEKSTWEEVCRNLAAHIFDGGDNSVKQILELSYKHLPDHLKPCFLYFGVFQEGKEVLVGKLLRLWIAEGFIRVEEGKSVEDVGEKYLMDLIDKSLVMVAKRRSDGGVKACALHDLLRDLCLKKCEEENFFNFVKHDTFLVYEKGHRIHVAGHHVVSTITCQHTRSLHGVTASTFHVRDMRLLRVLNCNSPSGINLSGIEYLINLRYLIISNLPPCMDKLESLECLHLASFNVVYLPEEIMKMRKLRYIQSPIGVKFDKNCDCSETSNLEYLYQIWITELRDEQMLRCLPKLRNLKCRYRPFSSHEDNSRERRYADLSFLTQLESLKIGPSKDDIKEISFPPNIKKLTLFSRPKDVLFIMNSEMMSVIGTLKNLEVLKLKSVSFEDNTWETKDNEFENLRYLKLCEVGDLNQWNVEWSQHFPRLQQLVLKDCKNLEEISSEIVDIGTLEMIEIQGRCHKELVESAKAIQHEQMEEGNKVLRVIISTAHSWTSNAGSTSY